MGAVIVSLTWNWLDDTMDWDVRPTSYDWPKVNFGAVYRGAQNKLSLISEVAPDKIMDAKRKLVQAWLERARSVVELLGKMAEMGEGRQRYGNSGAGT